MKRFTKRYALVYLFCILCLINVGATLFGVTRHAILIQNPGYICDYFTNFDNISKSDGFSIHGFWITLSAVPLFVYLIFCRTLPLARSLILGFICLVASVIPPAFYMTIHAGSVFSYLANYHWMNYLGAVITLICFAYVFIELCICKILKID